MKQFTWQGNAGYTPGVGYTEPGQTFTEGVNLSKGLVKKLQDAGLIKPVPEKKPTTSARSDK